MPRGQSPEPASTALALPDDIRNDLLRAQASQITTVQRLPDVKIMPAGAGLYEFSDTNDTVREFTGVILNSHARNLLWDRPYGSEAPQPVNGEGDPQNMPACVSSDGKFGVPRPGFPHAGLQGRVASGTERIACATCPYNQWESKGLIPALLRPNDSGKGKAVVNQRVLFIMVVDAEGQFARETPVQLTLPPTSLVPYDEYLGTLLNRGVPVQAVLTRFSQTRQTRGSLAWSLAVFDNARPLTEAEFQAVMGKRAQFRTSIVPQDSAAPVVDEGPPGGRDFDHTPESDEDLPF